MTLIQEPSVRDLTPVGGFGPLLRRWRLERGLSQESLAGLANVSQRHLSYLESGRTSPSRGMIVTLARALDIPLRDRNTMMTAAGFAAAYPAKALGDADMAPVAKAVGLLLKGHEPFPAFVIDPYWNVHGMNEGAARLLGRVIDIAAVAAALPAGKLPNMIELASAGGALQPAIVNWEESALQLAERLRHEALGRVPDARTFELISLLESGLKERTAALPKSRPEPLPFISFTLTDGRTETRWFTAIVSFGSPVDVTLQETRIEYLFPADAETEAYARAAALSDGAKP